MRARIALLEGEKRGSEGILRDLSRRCRMLEGALKGERSKFLSSTNALSTKPQGTQSVDSVPTQGSILAPTALHPTSAASVGGGSQVSSRASSSMGLHPPLVGGGIGGARDPRGRARSRDYLKQCLQEITYLTSPSTLNPLSTTSHSAPTIPRPKKLLPDLQIPPSTAPPTQPGSIHLPIPIPTPPPPTSYPSDYPSSFIPLKRVFSSPGHSATALSSPRLELKRELGPPPPPHLPSPTKIPERILEETPPQLAITTTTASPRPPLPTPPPPDSSSQRLTAIFAPASDESWKETLREAGKNAFPPVDEGLGVGGWDFDEDDEEEGRGKDGTEGEERKWSPVKTLRSHLDSVRSVSVKMEEDGEVVVVSGGDDMTVKVWRLENGIVAGGNTKELEPQATLRANTSAITTVLISPSTNRFYTASMDSTINVYKFPSKDSDTYGPITTSLLISGPWKLHSNSVWGLCLIPKEDGGELVVSIGAEGLIVVSNEDGELVKSWEFEEGASRKKKPGPTAIVAAGDDRIAVAGQDSSIRVWDVRGCERSRMKSDQTYDGTPRTQINALLKHPTEDWLISGHEDKYIRVFDIETGNCLNSLIAHLDSVTSLTYSPSLQTLISAGHDNSLRFWQLEEGAEVKWKSIQEIPAHRPKGSEGILDVDWCEGAGEGVLVSAGADGTVKLWA